MALAENFSVQWSSRLEALADQMREAIVRDAGSPFEKICIVVNDSATENWLKQFFLLDRKDSRVWMNLRFVKLPEFLNDWLAAMVHGTDPRRRQAARHPYSPTVMTWRICRILEQAAPEGPLKELVNYVGAEGDPKRRYMLAERLAKLFDDYQNSRFQMLRNWELGRVDLQGGVPPWQPTLYRLLVAEDANTYAKDYETAFRPETDAAAALRHGFPRYRAIHVFDVSFMQEPMLRLLEKIAEAVPLNVWCFNPQNDWLADTPSQTEAIRECKREMRRRLLEHREALQEGRLEEREVALFDVNRFYDSPEERLFGIFASGARALLWNLCNDAQGNVEPPPEDAVADLKAKKIAVHLHNTYSPRRELEAIRDGLCDFFRRNPDASPRDAVILCADWKTYAPIVGAVFGARGSLPVTMTGGTPEDTPFSQSFKELLDFRQNRFEVGAVFHLLGVPAIREKFGLDAAAVEVLRDMVQKANIHWGFDEEDVRRILRMTPEEQRQNSSDGSPAPYSFTWQRGFERLIVEMLYGFPDDDNTLLDVGRLRQLHPCGKMEGDRAGYASALWNFVSELYDLRRILAPGKEEPPAQLAEKFLQLLDTFYLSGEKEVREMLFVRKAIRQISEAAELAGVQTVSTDVFTSAAEAAVTGFIPGMHTPGEAVQFAPLNTYAATPHPLVWVCGLNDGAFPRMEHRSSYDLIGKHPSFFDASLRERDAFALLKAVLGARKQLVLSYVGKNARSRESVPPSVLLSDLLDYCKTVSIPVTVFEHPMHPYSRRYFYRTKETASPAALPHPAATQRQDAEIARALREKGQESTGTIPFPLNPDGVTEISLEELTDFLIAPNRYLLESKGVKLPKNGADRLHNRERLLPQLSWELIRKLVLTGECDPRCAVVAVETGHAPDPASAKEEIKNDEQAGSRKLKFGSKAGEGAWEKAQFNCEQAGKYETFSGIFQRFQEKNQDMESAEEILAVEAEGRSVHIRFRKFIPIPLETLGGVRNFQVFYAHLLKDQTKNRIWLQHLAANASGEPVATFLFGPDGPGVLFKPLQRDEALERWQGFIRLVSSPLPAGIPCAGNTGDRDQLPADWQRRLWTKGDFITTDQRGA